MCEWSAYPVMVPPDPISEPGPDYVVTPCEQGAGIIVELLGFRALRWFQVNVLADAVALWLAPEKPVLPWGRVGREILQAMSVSGLRRG